MKAARLVVLGVAIAAGGLAVMLASGPEQPQAPQIVPVAKLETVEVLTAKADIPVGHVVGAKDLQWQTWPAAAAGPAFIRKSVTGDSFKQFEGTIVRTAFVQGEPIREAKLLKADGSGFLAAMLPTGMRAVATQVSPETGAGGFILPNDRVDVILTRKEKVNGVDTPISETVLTGVRVLAIDQAIQEKEGQKVVVGKTATLELTQRQAETLALSQQIGSLSLALRSLADANAPNKPTPEDDQTSRRGGINMVRFGITTTMTK